MNDEQIARLIQLAYRTEAAPGDLPQVLSRARELRPEQERWGDLLPSVHADMEELQHGKVNRLVPGGLETGPTSHPRDRRPPSRHPGQLGPPRRRRGRHLQHKRVRRGRVVLQKLLVALVVMGFAAVPLVVAIAVQENAKQISALRSRISPRCVVGVDLSHSTDQANLRRRYLEGINEVIDACAKARGHFHIEVTGGPVADKGTWSVDADLAPPAWSANDMHQTEQVARLVKQRVADAVIHTNAEGSPACSDVVGGLTNLARAFQDASSTGPRRLVMFTDGVQTCPPTNLTTVPLDVSEIDQLLMSLRSAGLVPSLRGVQVYLVGLGDGPSRQLGRTRLEGIRQFWQAYITATGATWMDDPKTLASFS